MSLKTPENNFLNYLDLDGKYSEYGKKLLLDDSEKYYKRLEEQIQYNNLIAKKICLKIDNLLKEKARHAYKDIREIVFDDEYNNLCQYYGHLKNFSSSAIISEIETEGGIVPQIYDIIDDMYDYEDLGVLALFCFRRIQMLCAEQEVLVLFDELIKRNVSIFFLVEML